MTRSSSPLSQHQLTRSDLASTAAIATPADPLEAVQPTWEAAHDPVPGALAVTAAMLEHEVDALVEMTRQEAQFEADEAAESAPEPGEDASGGDEEPADEVDFFDAEDLAGELDSWGPEEVAAPVRSDPGPTSTPEPETQPTAIVENTMQEPTTEALFTETPAVSQVLAEPFTNDRLDAELQFGTLEPTTASTPDALAATVTPSETAEPTTVQTMTRVESSLGELRHALVELANRPQAQPLDVQPLVAAVQSGFVHSAADAAATNSAISSLAQQLGDFGKRVEVGVALAVRTALDREPRNETASASPVSFVVARTERSTIVLFGIGFLLLCWTAIFWFKTGSPRLALGTLVGANLIGCCLLAGRRRSC